METQSSPVCPFTVTVRRNPHRKARATPSTYPPPLPPPQNPVTSEISSFPIQEILAMQGPQPLPTSSTENLRVFLRIRPLTILRGSGKCGTRGNPSSKSGTKNAWPQNPTAKIKNKKNKNSEICIKVNDSQSVTLSPPSHLKDPKRIKSEVYEGFSQVFSADSTQEEVYKGMVYPLVEDFINGKSGMLAALGPSGSGKTHTVFGCPREPGMVPLALKQIFNRTGPESTRSFYISMFEIHSERGKGERLLDLSPGGSDLFMHQSTIKGLKEVIVSDVVQAESLIACGMLKRSTAMTNANRQSSRSQCIINIHSTPNKFDRGDDVKLNDAVLTIVDLAGAEREKRTGNQGARLLESNFINNTSMVFGLCLRSLLEHQKNPKKPLQKHFQNSLLTRYLRDYLEGKKRMALILTVKPGEEDHLDTSFLLRQASPYMKIKFHNVEEPSDMVSTKRHSQTLPRFEQSKRMKFSNLDASVIEEGNCARYENQLLGEEVSPDQLKEIQSCKNSNPDVNRSIPSKFNCVELAKNERNNQIMQGFAKALWNVLKQHRKKLEEAENEVQILRASLESEKTKYFELEKELKKLKSDCSCCKEEVIKVTLLKENINSEIRANGSTELEGHGFSNIEEINKDVRSTGNDLKAFEHDCSQAKCDSNIQQDLNAFLQVENSGMVDPSCLYNKDFKHQNSQEHRSLPGNGNSAEDLNDIAYSGLDDNHPKTDLTGSKLSESLFSFSQSLDMVNDNSTSSMELKKLHVEEDMKLSGPSLMPKEGVAVTQGCNKANVPETEAEPSSCSKPLLDPPLIPKEEVAVTPGCKIDIYNSCSKPLLNPALMPKEGVAVTRGCNVDTLPESEAEGDPPLISKEEVAVTQGCKTGIHNSCSKPLQDAALMPREGVAVTRGCNNDSVPESEAELSSFSKPLKAEKPRRRLLPASSILLRYIDDLDLEDENQKPKGSRDGNKLAAEETKRTQGSISLMRLLKSNLHL